MPIVDGRNEDYVNYFPLEEYVNRITLLPYVLEHVEETNRSFKEYLKRLAEYDEEYIIDYWIYQLYEELKFSKKIENIDFNRINLMNGEIFFDNLSISHRRIFELHNFITADDMEPTFTYRQTEANVSSIEEDGEQKIFWRGAQAKDVEKFMSDFIKIYRSTDISLVMSNPFLKSALVHLLFVRIHPFTDGNGRTARLLHNAKFTEAINRIYGTRLKISPLNLSQSILVNKRSYVNAIDNIYFDLEHDTNEAINRWFNTMLNMADEQIFFSSNKLEDIEPMFLKDFKPDDDTGRPSSGSMRIRKLKN